ncbi:MAG TPA: hemerythrin domain-containing protein [Acidimicrobiales bacterium]|nr:hemerythrin domain-containing protein [Acidimicrobiales bacterium]
MDAITILMNDHRTVDQLFTHLEGSPPGAEQRSQAVQEVIRELSVHAVIEEQVLYPAIREEVPGGEDLADHSIDEHQEVKEALARLERLDPADAETDKTLQQLTSDVRHHVGEEEGPGGLFERLRASVSQERLEEMGEQLEAAKKLAPTHPHPKAPSTPPGNVVAGAAAAIMDKARDAFGG